MPRKLNILPGTRYGKLVVIREVAPHLNPCGQASRMFLCRCDCGNLCEIRLCHLRSGHTISCGCVHKEQVRKLMTTHGMKKVPEYGIWLGMRDRCHNPNTAEWPRYGGRGITVCKRWGKFENFYADMGPRPFPKAQIDRIDNDGNYEPGNCRWVNSEQQQRNKSNNRLIDLRGKTQCLVVWCEELEIKLSTVYGRLYRGWSIERALEQPVRHLTIKRNTNVSK